MLIPDFEDRYVLGIAQMDDTHREFAGLVNQMESADKSEFISLFIQLIQHTEAHFAAENQLMKETAFPAIREHMGEHDRVLGDLHRLGENVAQGKTAMGRAYAQHQLPDWFNLHAQTMDSALAAHMKHSVVYEHQLLSSVD